MANINRNMTLKQHIRIAKLLNRGRDSLIKLMDFKNITKKEYKKIYGVIQKLDEVRGTLDSVYHNLIDDKTFKRLGHIYYGDSSKSKYARTMICG